jgi:hypothetical protein
VQKRVRAVIVDRIEGSHPGHVCLKCARLGVLVVPAIAGNVLPMLAGKVRAVPKAERWLE